MFKIPVAGGPLRSGGVVGCEIVFTLRIAAYVQM